MSACIVQRPRMHRRTGALLPLQLGSSGGLLSYQRYLPPREKYTSLARP